ncbi:MAG: glutamate--tRNA ligase [bacterium]|nr:glutamate--tRNA ligase [bacterium]
MNQSNTVRVRFAPSPTGNPHVGNFRTALYNYLFARHHGGEFLLRVEDTDRERSKPEYEDAILESLRWLGLELDGDPVRQSERAARHQAEANRLLAEGKAYRCRCTAERLDALREQQREKGETPMYDGHCREANHPDDGTPFCVRLKAPREGVTSIHDPIRGAVTVQNNELDDLVILRTDGSPTYNFAVVVDDGDMKITHVIRGDDHLRNTLRQVAIFDALGLELPRFAHLPQILGQDRTRLSKRHGAAGVLEYRDQGYLAEALVNYLARLGWGHGDQEVFTISELAEHFALENVNASAAVFDPQKLLWLAGEHMRRLPEDDLAARFVEHVQRRGLLTEQRIDNAPLKKIIACTRERSKTLEEMFDFVRFVFADRLEFDPDEAAKAFTPEAMASLADLADFAGTQSGKSPSHEEWENAFKAILEKHAIKMKVMAPAVRLALTGTKVSPPIFDVLDLLGTDEVQRRIQQALEYKSA